jgi:hypothetical protein
MARDKKVVSDYLPLGVLIINKWDVTMSEVAEKSQKSFARSAVFSFLLFLLLLVYYGPGVYLAMIVPIILLPANLFFINWPNGRITESIVNIIIRSICFVVALFILSVVWIKVFPSGQLGYGDRLQIHGRQIAFLGYVGLIKSSGFYGLLAFGCAVLVSLFMGDKNDNAI